MKILIARTDNLGDLVLTLPLAYFLKQAYPAAKVTFLAQAYAKAVVESAMYVDSFLNWDQLKKADLSEQKKSIEDYDVLLTLYSEQSIVKLAKKAGIKRRIATMGRWYHWLYCNRLFNFSRKRSTLHEAQMNMQFLKPLGLPTEQTTDELWPHIGLKPTALSTTAQWLVQDKFNLLIHPGSNGNGREWPVEYFIGLINSLDTNRFHVIITGGAADQAKAELIAAACPLSVNLAGKTSLDELLDLIAKADGLLASGTGPLHLAAALGIHTLGLFPAKRPIDPPRWRPIGKQASYLVDKTSPCAAVCDSHDCACMRALTADLVSAKLNDWANQQGVDA